MFWDKLEEKVKIGTLQNVKNSDSPHGKEVPSTMGKCNLLDEVAAAPQHGTKANKKSAALGANHTIT